MPIPELNIDALLPPGVHECTLEEVGRRFGRFQRTSQRQELFGRLEAFAKELISTGKVTGIVIDGSFVTGIDHPNDIDIILVLSPDLDDFMRFNPSDYNRLSPRPIRKRYGFDVIAVAEGSQQLTDAIAFFQLARSDSDVRKGVLRVKL